MVTSLSVHTSLAGTILVYLILLGDLLHEIKYVSWFSKGYLTLFCAIVLFPIILFFKTIKDITWIGVVSAIAQFIAIVVSITQVPA